MIKKINYFLSQLKMGFYFCSILFIILSSTPSSMWAGGFTANHQNPFVSALPSGTSLYVYGDFIATGNSVLCQNNGRGGCDHNYNEYLFNSDLMYKKENPSIPLNSAKATLSLPAGISGADIVWAGLYWQGHIAGKDAGTKTNNGKPSTYF